MSESHEFFLEEAAQHVNDNNSLFWIVSCPLPLHVECFMPALVGVNQTMIEAGIVLISFNVALCAYVLGCDCACVIE